MITNNQLIYAIQKEYPHLRHGVDYWAGHEVDGDTQIAPARIYAWNAPDIPEPNRQELDALAAQHAEAYEHQRLSGESRARRDSLLSEADILWLRAQEMGQDTAALSTYRQALRDVPQQEGFPFDIEWPEAPTT